MVRIGSQRWLVNVSRSAVRVALVSILSGSLLLSSTVRADQLDDRMANPQFEATRLELRDRLIGIDGRAAYRSNDLVENLVELPSDQIVRNVTAMDQMGLRAATLPTHPWSDDYWAIYKGVLGARYADGSFPNSSDWSVNASYVKADATSFQALTQTGRTTELDRLSPAEKYDLLVGDKNLTLTKAMWAEGESYFNSSGKVETWMGICHGWAAASYMLPRPAKVVTVVASDGKTRVNFYPSDIKALSSLLWAKYSYGSRFISSRCNKKDPSRATPVGNTVGRVDDNVCFDTNPGTWHMTVVNRIGIEKKSFVMDATFDYEVWNQPVKGYSINYFNPKTGKSTSTLQSAVIPYSEYKNDPYAGFRKTNSNLKKIVGVEMRVEYVVETSPNQSTYNSSQFDLDREVTYRYDLELDADGKILGGEWHTKEHPDFLWTPSQDERAVSVGDYAIANAKWDTSKAVPAIYKVAASRASAHGQPLAAVVEGLLSLSKE
jgi:hypothetical protein